MNFKKSTFVLLSILMVSASSSLVQAVETVCQNYDLSAKYYDRIMESRTKDIEVLFKLIESNGIKTCSVLELACGTGRILKLFENKSETIYGLDISSPMLEIAKEKISKGTFLNQNMSNFSLKEKFDLIFCMFDSINHLLDFESWKGVFESASKSLKGDGVFIFDMNPLPKLKDMSENQSETINDYGDFKEILNFISSENKFSFISKIIDNDEKSVYESHITETAFEFDNILSELRKYFKEINIYNSKIELIEPNSTTNSRIYFVCKIIRDSSQLFKLFSSRTSFLAQATE